MPTLIDSYSNTNASSVGYIMNGYRTKEYQSFTNLSSAYNLTYCTFYLYQYNSPTGNITASLYAHSGTYGTSSVPTGTALATSGAVSASGLSTSASPVDFTFSTPYTMSANTQYTIVLEFSGGDMTNRLAFNTDNTSPTHGGNTGFYDGSYTATPTIDMIFYVYGELPAVGPANLKTANGLAKASVKTRNGLAIASIKTWNGLA